MVIFQPNNSLMAEPRLRERDLLPQRIFFYERSTDGQILVFTEQEADLIGMKSSHRHILKQIGCSDGRAYTKYLRECGVKVGEMIPKSRAREILKGAFNAELEAARGQFSTPQAQNVHFDGSFPLEQRNSFVPPR